MSFFLIAIVCLQCFNKTYAGSNLTITKLGNPYSIGNDTIQDISLSLKTKKNWKLLVTSLNNGLLNTSSPSNRIPVSRITIQDNSSSNIYPVQYITPVIIESGNNNENIDARYSIKISNSDASYPGTYTGNLLFSLVSSGGTNVENFTLSFTQNPVQDISITPNHLNINVDSQNSLLNNYSQESASPVRIYIRSNQKWKLVLKGIDRNNSLSYAFKVLSGTNNAKLYYNSAYTLLPDSNLTIAEGDPTVFSDGNSLDSVVIEVNYRLTTGNSSIFPAGAYPYNLMYYLSPS
ncbi:MAG: hypothetical protein A2104_07865 [Candidatus Melainabacteria bacterium GWF2_32_7]|nr:MAG: hypothetical protein A2104_07865 [Candidatus Melainabacteria bacterium GWF2_32_7]